MFRASLFNAPGRHWCAAAALASSFKNSLRFKRLRDESARPRERGHHSFGG
jgi:hypothetical protein